MTEWRVQLWFDSGSELTQWSLEHWTDGEPDACWVEPVGPFDGSFPHAQGLLELLRTITDAPLAQTLFPSRPRAWEQLNLPE
jgi:hypothetical protein